MVVSSGGQAVTGKLVGAGHELEVQLQPIAEGGRGSPGRPWLIVGVVLALLNETDPAADHIFIYTLLFYQLYNLYMLKSGKNEKNPLPFQKEMTACYDVLPLLCSLIYQET